MGKIKVGFDISQLAHGGGVATYTLQLTQKLTQIKDLEMVYFYSSLRKPYLGQLKVLSYPIPPTLLELIFNRIRLLSIDHLIGSVEIFHSSDWIQPPTKAKKVTTYHDVVPLKFPQWSHPRIVEVHRRRLKIVEEEIDRVIAVSQSTKNDLLAMTNISEDKIVVIYEGVSKIFQPLEPQQVEQFRKESKLPDRFVLAIGGVGERRNLAAVRKACTGYHLVIAGETIPWLSYGKLPLLYNAATVLLYPSLYEGFGLPILEAMASGVPVITSNVSSMPEVGGEAALYVNPHQVTDITDKLRMVMEDEKLRQQLTKKGLAQAKQFSWQKCAEETAQLYCQLHE